MGGLEHFFHSVGNVIIPIDELIFFRGLGQPPTRHPWYHQYEPEMLPIGTPRNGTNIRSEVWKTAIIDCGGWCHVFNFHWEYDPIDHTYVSVETINWLMMVLYIYHLKYPCSPPNTLYRLGRVPKTRRSGLQSLGSARIVVELEFSRVRNPEQEVLSWI